MIRALLRLNDHAPSARRYGALLLLSALLRAGSTLSLVPLLASLFSPRPVEALPWLALLAVLVVTGWFVDRLLGASGFDIGFRILLSVETRVLDRLERIPLGWLTAERRADARRALTSAGQEICQGFAYLLTPAANALSTPLLVGIGLLFVAWPLGVTMIAAVPVLLGALWASGRLVRAADDAYARSSDEAGARIIELAQHQAALRAAGRAGSDDSALGAALAGQRRAALRLVGLGVPGQLLFGVITQLALLALAAITVVLFLDGTLTAPLVVALVIVAVRFLEPFTTLSELATPLQALRGTVGRVDALLAAPQLPAPAEGLAPRSEAAALEFDDVAFGYEAEPTVSGVSFSVPRGGTTAIVGPSGSGKSTLLALAARLHEVTSGGVRIAGQDVRDYAPEELSRQFAAVFQHVYLFDGTLRENVLMGRPRASEQELAHAASAAGLDEALQRLPQGWDTRVGEGGTSLSGGERQRVSIARALLKRAPLLLLDEATSALDTENERSIVAALAAGAEDRATVIVAHRLATIAGADQVVFLEEGRIVEVGSPEELRVRGGRFAEYWSQRHEAAGWNLTGAG